MKILITGSSGYIGSHLVQLLNKENYKLYGLDVNDPVIQYDTHFYADIKMPLEIKEEFDCVIHLAAKVNVGESVKYPSLYYETNTFGTLNILRNIKTNNFIFASTGAAQQLTSPYGISKKAAEEIVSEYCTNNNINYTIFRFYNVIGADGILPTNPDGLFFNLVNAIQTKTFNLFGDDYNTIDGTCIRDYVHVNEICNAIKIAIKESSNKIENLGHGNGHSVKEIIKLFKQVNDCNFDVNICNRRPGDIEISVLDSPSPYMKQIYTINDLLKIM